MICRFHGQQDDDEDDDEDDVDDESLYPGELAAISLILAHQLRYDAKIRDGISKGVLDEDVHWKFRINNDITAVVINLTPHSFRVVTATMLLDSWCPEYIAEPDQPAKGSIRLLQEQPDLNDRLNLYRWLFFTVTHKAPLPGTAVARRNKDPSGEDSGYGSSGGGGELKRCGSDCEEC
jgi:hypothetical protein